MKKYYSINLDKQEASKFRIFLKQNNYYYEPSACYDLVHFEIKLDIEEVQIVDDFLQTI